MVKQQVIHVFEKNYSTPPLLVFSPGRLNIIGEHTDYNEGFVFPAAIDKGIYAAFEKSSQAKCNAHAIDLNEHYEFELENIHPLKDGGWRNYLLGVIDGIQKKGKTIEPFNLVFGGDIPGGAGLSSSAALENAIVCGLNKLFDLQISPLEMILISQQAEHEFVGVKCGIMDQFASMFGQEDAALLLDCRSIEAKPYKIDLDQYQILLINTNVKHKLADSAYNQRRAVCEKVADLLGARALRDATTEQLNQIRKSLTEEEYQMALYVIEENQRTIDAGKAMLENDIFELGQLMFASHRGLQHQYKVSCTELDFLADLAEDSDAVIGARMMGGGFGGCTINLIQKDEITQFAEDVSKAFRSQFGRPCSIYQVKLGEGTRVL